MLKSCRLAASLPYFILILSEHQKNSLENFQTVNFTFLCTFKTAYTTYIHSLPRQPLVCFFSSVSSLSVSQTLRSNPRPISNSQLHTLLYFHLCPIYLVVFKGSYSFRMGYLILRGASRLDAFSVYPFRTWLPCHEPGSSTGTPAVRPSRSSRTKDSSSQISSAHAG